MDVQSRAKYIQEDQYLKGNTVTMDRPDLSSLPLVQRGVGVMHWIPWGRGAALRTRL